MNQDQTLKELWINFQKEFRCSVDKMLCYPELRNAFVEEAKKFMAIENEGDFLWRLVALRKRKELPSNLK